MAFGGWPRYMSSREELPSVETGFAEEVDSDNESNRPSRRSQRRPLRLPVAFDPVDFISAGRDPILEPIPVATAPVVSDPVPDAPPENDDRRHYKVQFPEGSTYVKTVLNSSDTGAYSAEERLLLYLTFFLTTGFWCNPADFAFPKLAADMTALWETTRPGGFRAAVAEMRRPDLHPIPAEADVFADLEDLHDGVLDYQDVTEQKAPTPSQPANTPTTAQSPTVISDEELPDTDIDDDPVVFDRPSELHQQALDDGREQMAMRAAINNRPPNNSSALSDTESDHENDDVKAVTPTTQIAAVENALSAIESKAAGEPISESKADDLVAELAEDIAVESRRAADEAAESKQETGDASDAPTADSDSEATVEDEKHSAPPRRVARAPATAGESPEAAAVAVAPNATPQGRRRGYIMLAVDDGSKWAQRATERAAYWTQRLATMQRQGSLAQDAWDGSPITAQQWNEKTGSPALRALFTRDRLVEYQAYRRELVRGVSAPMSVAAVSAPDPTQAPIPFDPKVRGSRRRRGAPDLASVPTPKQAKSAFKKTPRSEVSANPQFKRGPVDMDDRMDFGSSMPTMTLRELLDKTNITKWTKKGQGLLEKAYHLLIVNPKGLPLVGDDSGAAHFMSTMTAKVCLRTMLFFANPSFGDPLLPGISKVVFQVGFEDIFNLFRAQPQLIPPKFVDLFTGSDSTYNFDSNKRWNKRDTPRKFASFVDTWTRKVLAFPDEFKQMVLMLNGFIQFQVADEAHSGLTVGKPESSILSLFNPEDMGGTVALLVNLGIPFDSLLEIITMIKLTFEENIDYFMRHALHRLTARQDR